MRQANRKLSSEQCLRAVSLLCRMENGRDQAGSTLALIVSVSRFDQSEIQLVLRRG